MAKLAPSAGLLRQPFAAALLGLLLVGCAGAPYPSGPPGAGGGGSKRNAYQIDGEWYYPRQQAEGYVERGKASWYGGKFHGRRTANGEVYDMHRATAAHRTLPLPTLVEVTNLENGRTARVRVNDRGPFVDTHERIIDLSYGAAQSLGMDEQGVARVKVRAIAGPDELQGGDSPPPGDPGSGSAGSSPGAAPSGRSGGSDSRGDLRPRPGQEILYLQVGAFRQPDNAARLKQRIRRADLGRVVVTTGQAQSGPVYRVRMGPLESVLHADRLARQLRRQGIQTGHIVRE
jgi:rare lipoprotein A